LANLKSAQAPTTQARDQSGEYSDDDEQLDLNIVQREEKLDAVVTRAHNCLLASQKLNAQMILMLKGWKATLT
jgi:hypothetical protein